MKGLSSKKVTRWASQLKCLYTNTHNLGNKQEVLDATALLENLWVTVRERGSKGSPAISVYNRPLDQAEPNDEAFYLQLQEASQ